MQAENWEPKYAAQRLLGAPAAPIYRLCTFNYETAFARNIGLISANEQQILRNSRVAIAGMGGVGGVHLLTLVRLGIGKFTIADPDVFETANFNRQAGAKITTIGRSKVEVMAAEARAINPDVEIDVWSEAITHDNATDFLAGSDVFLDGVDFFALGARRLLFATARELGLWGVTAGPIGFSTAWLAFDPRGMSFERYFDFENCPTELDRLIAFGVGLAPAATHMSYIDLEQVDIESNRGPSLSLACQLAGGVAAGEVVKIILCRGQVRAAPCYQQFDVFTSRLRQGRLLRGNRHPWQRVKRWYLRRRFSAR